jgi:hypothetical protein
VVLKLLFSIIDPFVLGWVVGNGKADWRILRRQGYRALSRDDDAELKIELRSPGIVAPAEPGHKVGGGSGQPTGVVGPESAAPEPINRAEALNHETCFHFLRIFNCESTQWVFAPISVARGNRLQEAVNARVH